MGIETACCFSGHRVLPNRERQAIAAALEREIAALLCRGVRDFWAGGALGFDTLAAQTVLSLRERQREIRLLLALPCEGQDRNWSAKDREIYRRLREEADDAVLLSAAYYNGCMQRRNRFMVEESRFLICYLTAKGGGTAYTVRYAKEKGREILNLAAEDREPHLFSPPG